MSQEMLLAIVGAVALVIGLLIGRAIGGSSENGQAAKKASKELEKYKEAVSEHFGKTADLVDNLTDSYKEVFDHLRNSTHTLLSEDKVQQHIASRANKAITLTYTPQEGGEQSGNPMEAAQAEIQSETIVDETKAEAEKMAKAIADTNAASEKTETTEKKDV